MIPLLRKEASYGVGVGPANPAVDAPGCGTALVPPDGTTPPVSAVPPVTALAPAATATGGCASRYARHVRMIGAQYASGASVAFFSPEYSTLVTIPPSTRNVAWQYAPFESPIPPTIGRLKLVLLADVA